MTPADRTSPGTPGSVARRRATPGGFSSLLLLAVTVQLSLAMLEWAGPGSADTRQRLATTIVAAAHRGVFTEPSRPERPRAPKPLGVESAGPERARGEGVPAAGLLARLRSGWATALPPPAC